MTEEIRSASLTELRDMKDRGEIAANPGAPEPQAFGYTNYRGDYALREMIPFALWHGSTEWHPERQFFIKATDTERGVERDFALKDFGLPEEKFAQAYQVIGYLLGDNFDTEEGNRLLDYFSDARRFDPDFLPWPGGDRPDRAKPSDPSPEEIEAGGRALADLENAPLNTLMLEHARAVLFAARQVGPDRRLVDALARARYHKQKRQKISRTLRNTFLGLQFWKAKAEARAEALAQIADLSTALRSGGPDPDDLQGLSDALEQAVELAAGALK